MHICRSRLGDMPFMTGEELLVCAGEDPKGIDHEDPSSGIPGEEIRDSTGLREPHEFEGELPARLASKFNCMWLGSMCCCVMPGARTAGEYGNPSAENPALMGSVG